MGKITRNYLYNLAYQLLVILTPIITAPYLTRVLGADNLGIYGYISSSANVIITCSLLGIFAYGSRQTAYVRDNRRELTETFWEIAMARLVLGITGTFIYGAFAVLHQSYRFLFFLYYPFILAQFIDCTWVYVGMEDMRPAVTKNFVTRLANVAGIFLLVRKREDLWIYVLLLAATSLIATAAAYTQLRKYVGKPAGKWQRFFYHIKGSVSLFLPQAAAMFYLQVDKVMLQWLTGRSSQVSFYDYAEKMINIPLSLITVLSTVMMPRIANEFKNGNKEQISSLLGKAGRYTLFMAFPLMFGLAVISGQFIPWYLGEEYSPSAVVMVCLAPIVLFNALAGISGQQYFTATNQNGILLRAYGSAAILNVVINALLIPKYGCLGAAAATVASSLISMLIQYHYLNRQVGAGHILEGSGKYLGASLVMALVVFGISRRMPARPLTTLIQAAVGILVYGLLMAACEDDTLRELTQRVIKKRKQDETDR